MVPKIEVRDFCRVRLNLLEEPLMGSSRWVLRGIREIDDEED
jgi:hypothetical protein